MRKRCLIIVLDSLGVGAQYDAEKYGDKGCDTLTHICEWWHGKLHLPHMGEMGLGNIGSFPGIPGVKAPTACYGKMEEKSKGKDTTVGHWEISGLITDAPFPTYPQGFPQELIEQFVTVNKLPGALGNKTASGTQIIDELGEEHEKTGAPIVYTSADSVFQIAAHESIIPIEKLYKICEEARKLLVSPHNVARVIARPFIGTPKNYKRTERRRDFSVLPPHDTMLNLIQKAGLDVVSIGKINDIFSGSGITKSTHTKNNSDGIQKTIEALKETEDGLIFTNLVEFDMLFGHRNDPEGYGMALADFDAKLPQIMEELREGDLLIITGDHGCDPTFPGTDHTRETPLILAYSNGKGQALGTRKSFADIAASVLEWLELPAMKTGESFKNLL